MKMKQAGKEILKSRLLSAVRITALKHLLIRITATGKEFNYWTLIPRL
jgi:hypothetical protein